MSYKGKKVFSAHQRFVKTVKTVLQAIDLLAFLTTLVALNVKEDFRARHEGRAVRVFAFQTAETN